MPNCCAVCMKPLDGTDWLCHACAKLHEVEGAPYREWPDYVRALADEEQKARRMDNAPGAAGCVVIPLSQCPEAEVLAYGDNPDPQFASVD